jgi:hypothetical protein
MPVAAGSAYHVAIASVPWWRQSLADLRNSFEAVETMRMVPVTRQAVLQLGAATLAPVMPLALTMMSPEELLKTPLGTLF